MVSKLKLLIPIIIMTAIVGVLGIAFIPDDIKNKQIEFPLGTIRIDNSVIKVEIAESAAERQRWLTFRQNPLPLNSALMLVYDKADYHSLWLLNINFDLDLLWVNENGEIVYIISGAKPCEDTLDSSKCTYKNTLPAKYVIASSKGFIDKNKITMDSKVKLISV